MEKTNNMSEQLTSTEFYMLNKCMNKLETEKEIADVLMDTEFFPNFSKGLTDFIEKYGYVGDSKDYIEKAKYLYQHIVDSGVDMKKFPTRETIRHWFNSKTIPYTDNDRLHMQRICLAFRCNLEQTTDFFRKVFLGMPFNFRNAEECIHYFCIKNGKSYQEAYQLEKLLSENRHHTSQTTTTQVIKDKLSQFEAGDEMELLSYLIEYVPEQKEYYKTARDRISTLIDRCIQNTKNRDTGDPAKINKKPNTDQDKKYKGINYLMFKIYEFSTDTSHSAEDKRSFYKNLPKALIRNFPKQHEVGKAIQGKNKGSSEMLRKCLILLKFYEKYNIEKRQPFSPSSYKASYNMNRFIAETNCLLDECGFQELYVRNPYDFIFLYCVYHTDKELEKASPDVNFETVLDMFRDLMDEMHDNSP